MRRLVSDVKLRFRALLTRVFSFVTIHRNQTVMFAILVLLGAISLALPARAVDTPDGFFNSILTAVSWMLLKLANVCMGLTVFGLKFFIELARYNNFIEAPPVVIGWVMVRDLANMFFIVVLLLIAFGTILGMESYEWKKMLGKLIMAAIFINFSKLIAQLMIDVAHVFTMTFLNAVSATAGGNLINMFHLNGMLKMVSQDPSLAGTTDIRLDIFAGAVLALVFAAFAMATVFAYFAIMAIRVVVLWVLMILAPLAYILGVLPQGKSYADEYWQEFTKHVLVAPIMVFFLWLAFATLGNGMIAQRMQLNLSSTKNVANGILPEQATAPSASILEVTTWENMASFIMAIAFMAIGIEMVQRLGVRGGGFASSAVGFAKNVATIASGYAAGRWLADKGVSGLKTGAGLVGKGLYIATLDNAVQRTKNWGERQVEGYRSWRAQGPSPKMRAVMEKAKQEDIKTDAQGRKYDSKSGQLIDGEGYLLNEQGGRIQKKNEDGSLRYEFDRDEQGNLQFEDTRGSVQKFLHGRNEKLIKSKKLLEKVTKQKGVREELVDKRVTANPKYFMQRFEGPLTDALDRVEQGQLEAEKLRSAAKTKEFGGLGKQLVLQNDRFKDGEFQSKEDAEKKGKEYKGTFADQIAKHEEEAGRTEERIKDVLAEAKKDFRDTKKGKNLLQAKIESQMRVKANEGDMASIEAKMKGKAAKSDIERAKDIQTDLKRGILSPERREELIEEAKKLGFAVDKDNNVKSTIARLAAAQAEQKAAEGDVSVLEGKAKEAFTRADVTKARQIERELKNRATTAQRRQELLAEAKALGYTVDHNQVMGTVGRTVAAEKAAHTEAEKVKDLTTSEERRYYRGHHGQEELREEAGIRARMLNNQTKIQQMESEATSKFFSTTRGKAIAANTQSASFGKQAFDSIVKRLEEEAILSLVNGHDKNYEQFLEAQSFAKIAGDELSSVEKGHSNDEMLKRMQEGREAEKQAQALIAQANSIHTTRADKDLTTAAKIQTEVSNYNLQKRKLEKAVKDADPANKQAEQAKLDAFLQLNKAKNDQRVRVIKKLKDRATKSDLNDLTQQQKDQQQQLRERATSLRQNSSSWRYAAAKALEEESALAMSVDHNMLLSDVEQEVVYNGRGIQTPTSALTQPIEKFAKEYTNSDYDMFVNNLHGNLRMMINKRKKEEDLKRQLAAATVPADQERLKRELEKNKVTNMDKAAMAGLLVKGQQENWIDDAIWKYMDTDLAQEIQGELGWTNTEFNNKKINDIMSIFASGGDLKFAGLHTQIGDLMDIAQRDLGISLTDFYDKLEKGINGFTQEERTALQSAVNNPGRDGKQFNVDDALRQDNVKYYLDQIDDNQAQIQLITNMRDKAAASSHPENGGHGKFVGLKNGKYAYVLTGEQMASDSVMGEVRKMGVGTRAAMQTHATARLDERSGFVTKIDEQKNTYVRGDITSANDHRGTNVRYENQTSGLSPDAEKVQYQSDTLGFLATGKKTDGNYSERHEWAQQYEETAGKYKNIDKTYKRNQKLSVVVDKNGTQRATIQDAETAKLQQTSNDIVTDLFAPRIFSNAPDWLLTMGKQSGITDVDALAGKIDIGVMIGGRETRLTQINDLIDYYNAGAFTFGKAPKRKIPQFKPPARNQAGGQNQGGNNPANTGAATP